MKRILVFLAALALLWLPVEALGLGGTPQGAVVLDRVFAMDQTVLVLEEDETLTAETLMPTGPYLSESGQPVLVPLAWDLTVEALSQPGLHLVSAVPVLQEGMSLAEGFDPTITWPVFRKGEDAFLEVATVEQSNLSSVMMRQYGDPASELTYRKNVNGCMTSEGWILKSNSLEDLFWEWDLSAVDAETLGAYTVTGRLVHPDWLRFPAELTTVEEKVYVLPEDRIELYAAIGLTNNGVLELSWLYDSDQVTQTVLERKNEAGAWEACDTRWYRYAPSMQGLYDYFHLYVLEMPTETPLVLRLRYQDVVDGAAVERFTEPITLTLPANIADLVAATNGQVVVDILSGDRDGGDSGGEDLPDYEQPAPDWDVPVWRPETEKPEPVLEVVTDTDTALSGTRLNQLVQLAATVLFEKQGVAVEIPAPLLETLELEGDQLLEVTILQPAANAVELHVLANGAVVTDLTGTVVRLPWEAGQGTALQVLNLNGTVLGQAVYEETGMARFVIDQPGTYWLHVTPVDETPVPQESQEPQQMPPAAERESEPAEPEPLPVEPVQPQEPARVPPAAEKPAPAPEQAAMELVKAPEKEQPLWPWLLSLLLLVILVRWGVRRWRRD